MMMEPGCPDMTVLMPVYNGEKYLRKSMESILQQTWQRFEFLIINDGSTDGTAAILDHYRSMDNRIRVYDQENSGVIASLNKGCRLAKGRYIARMDADDVSLPTRLERQLHYLEHHQEVGVLGTWMEQIDEDAGHLDFFRPPITHDLIAWRMLFECVLAHPTVVMRKTLLEKAGGYSAAYRHIEDTELWSRLIHVTRFSNLPETLYVRRVHKDSICSMYGDRQYEVGVEIRCRMFQDLLHGIVGREVVEWLSMVLHEKRSLQSMQITPVTALLCKAYGAFIKQHQLESATILLVEADLLKRLITVDRRLDHMAPLTAQVPLSESIRASQCILGAFHEAIETGVMDRKHSKGMRRKLAVQMLLLIRRSGRDRLEMSRACLFAIGLSPASVISILGLKVLLLILLGPRMFGVIGRMRNRVRQWGH
jgi:glycosyltransferase involved in cell wall biosynthesis